MNFPKIVNIQKFSVHDGDGIRTTIFFKGCPLSCWWCHNPESQSYEKELLFDSSKCSGCGLCEKVCPEKSIIIKNNISYTDKSKCTLCEKCFDYCVNENRQSVGKQYTVKELLNIIKRDLRFYEESGGGVTLSGGEVMTQDIDFLLELSKLIKKEDINLAVDTSGYAKTENYKKILPYVDTFLYDFKILDDEKHKKYIGKSNKLILKNLKYLAENNANINIRIPVITPVNSDIESMVSMIDYIKNNIGIVKVNLLPYHNTGSSKYQKLKRPYLAKDFTAPNKDEIDKLKNFFIINGFNNIKIGG